MKIFNQTNPFPTKVNFVDENNVFVGYDMEQDCCEEAGWFIAEGRATSSEDIEADNPTPDVESYSFDPEYYEELTVMRGEECNIAVFRLVRDDKPDLFLHLYNTHNGYYSHGFEMKVDGALTRNGSI